MRADSMQLSVSLSPQTHNSLSAQLGFSSPSGAFQGHPDCYTASRAPTQLMEASQPQQDSRTANHQTEGIVGFKSPSSSLHSHPLMLHVGNQPYSVHACTAQAFFCAQLHQQLVAGGRQLLHSAGKKTELHRS